MKNITLFLLLTISVNAFTQELERQGQKSLDFDSTYKSFVNKNKTKTRMEFAILNDFRIATPAGIYTQDMTVALQKVTVNGITKKFLTLEIWDSPQPTNYPYVAHITKGQLKNVIDALDVMLISSAKDRLSTRKAFTNYYRTEDGFEIGYVINFKNKKTIFGWYIILENEGFEYFFKIPKEKNFYKIVDGMKTAYEIL